MYPTRKALDNRGAMCVTIFIWVFASLLACPLPIISHVETVDKNRHECTELSSKTVVREVKLVYSVFGMIFQYIFPLIIILTVYHRIYRRMTSRMERQAMLSSPNPVNISKDPQTNSLVSFKEKKHLIEAHRQRKVNILLFGISLVFALSWLPLNINNLVMDIHLYYYNSIIDNSTEIGSTSSTPSSVSYSQTVLIVQAICLLLVLSSACTNPILYSWLNENFRREFQRFFFWRKRHDRSDTNETMCSFNCPTYNEHTVNTIEIIDRC